MMQKFTLIIIAILFLLSSCENRNTTQHTPKTNSEYHTNEIIIEETEIHYENVCKMLDFDKNVFTHRVIDGTLWTVLHDGVSELCAYDQSASMISTNTVSDEISIFLLALTEQKQLIIPETDQKGSWCSLVLKDTDGTVIKQSPKIRTLQCRTSHFGIASFGENILYYGDYTLYYFTSIDAEPIEYELPCLINRIHARDDGTYLLYGRIDQVLNSKDHYYVFDPTAQTITPYIHSDTVEDPLQLFVDAHETYYKNGEFYANCDTGLYVYRDGAPVELINWENSYLDADSIEIKEILSDDCCYITYFDTMNRRFQDQLLIRTEERFTKPREIVRLAAVGLDMDHRQLMEAAVFRFNSINRDYKIDLTDYDADRIYSLSD